MDSLYKEEILEHYYSPQNFGKLATFDVSSQQLNPFCGDEIEIYIRIKNHESRSKEIDDIGFTGKGCAISIASASLLTEFAKKKPLSILTNFSQEDMLQLLGVEISDTRKKCALLALAVLRDCLNRL
jgi:nitrogen fixation NifU-like protein